MDNVSVREIKRTVSGRSVHRFHIDVPCIDLLLLIPVLPREGGQVDLDELERATNLVRNIAQVLAIGLAGLWTYLKFIRGRTFRVRGELEVTGRLFTFDDESALVVKVTFKNTGLSRISVRADHPPYVLVTRVETGGWREGGVTWTPSDFMPADPGWRQGDNEQEALSPTPELVRSTATMLTRHRWIEPGEMIQDEQIVVPFSETDAGFVVAYRVQAVFYATEGWHRRRPILWTAYAVVPGIWLIEASHRAAADSHPWAA